MPLHPPLTREFVLVLAKRYATDRLLPEARVIAASETWFDAGGSSRRLSEAALNYYLDGRFTSRLSATRAENTRPA